jgi:predicted ATPase
MFGLSYLEPHHSLRYRETELDQLSPGEKGTLLLMFYLLVDPSRSPLLLDQPDENLDNQTIKNLLVPAMKEAGARRQVLVVTHNPNVAVVADADQLVVADREDDRFVYRTGAIEDTPINKDVVDVLEGTWPAFRNRQDKYQPPS